MDKLEDAGSPPLTRGKENKLPESVPYIGITPAYAGKSCTVDCCICAVGDHPRLRGEKLVMIVNEEGKLGSPPLTRGKAIYRR